MSWLHCYGRNVISGTLRVNSVTVGCAMKQSQNSSAVPSKKTEMYNVENCFMFEEEETPEPPESAKNSALKTHSKGIEFRTDKPYRLALYVQPVLKRKVDLTNSNVLANLSLMRRNRNKENISTYKQTKLTKEKVNVSLFDEECDVTKKEKITKPANKSSTEREQSSKTTKKSILSFVNTNECVQKRPGCEVDVSSLPKTKQKKIRRSYVKKLREYTDSEKVVEPPSDQILKEMDLKKITRSKVKKPNKEDQEFEKWAENMNTAFDDIDKFELSINYD